MKGTHVTIYEETGAQTCESTCPQYLATKWQN